MAKYYTTSAANTAAGITSNQKIRKRMAQQASRSILNPTATPLIPKYTEDDEGNRKLSYVHPNSLTPQELAQYTATKGILGGGSENILSPKSIGTGSVNMPSTTGSLAAPPFSDVVGRLFGRSLTPQDIAAFFDFGADPQKAAWNLIRASGGSTGNPYMRSLAGRIGQQGLLGAIPKVLETGETGTDQDLIYNILGSGGVGGISSSGVPGIMGGINSLLRQSTQGAELSPARRALAKFAEDDPEELFSMMYGPTMAGGLRGYLPSAVQSASRYFSDVLAPTAIGFNLLDYLTGSMNIPFAPVTTKIAQGPVIGGGGSSVSSVSSEISQEAVDFLTQLSEFLRSQQRVGK